MILEIKELECLNFVLKLFNCEDIFLPGSRKKSGVDLKCILIENSISKYFISDLTDFERIYWKPLFSWWILSRTGKSWECCEQLSVW